MLNLWRRHTKKCPHDEREYVRCQCPIWIDWTTTTGGRIRKPPGLRDWQAAQRRARDMEADGLTAISAPTKYPGNGKRLKALTELMLATGLRIGDACTIARDKVVRSQEGYSVELYTAKTGEKVYCPITVSIMLAHSSVKITQKHYAAWTKERREKIEAAIRKTWNTENAQPKPSKSGTSTAHRLRTRKKPA
jgi:integrase